jgi:hypothetical protein
MSAAMAPPAPPLEPATASDARRRLDLLTKDPSWGAKYLGADPAARREFAELHEKIAAGDPVADAIAGTAPAAGEFETTTDGQLPRHALAQTVASFRELGLNDAIIEQALKGGGETPESIAATRVLLNQRKSDPAWRERLLAGGMSERRELQLMSIILAGEPA